LPVRSVARVDIPVTLPPGRARLPTRPVPTGSPAAANTIGMTDVACFAATTFAVPDVTMTSTLSWTNSAANSAERSLRPSPHRYSIVTVRPWIQPSLPSRCSKLASRWPSTDAVLWPRYPMVGSFAGCCARAASGHAPVAPPSSVMKSRRLMGHPLPTSTLYHIVEHGCVVRHSKFDPLVTGLGHSRHLHARGKASPNVRYAFAGSIVQCNTACSLSAGVSKPKVFRGR
jgi:hypothetical protein